MSEATERAQRTARGQSGMLRVGFAENASWHGVVPNSFRRFRERVPGGELQLNPMPSLEQLEVVRAGQIDAGFIYNMTRGDRELDQLQVGRHGIALAVPKAHPLSRQRRSACAIWSMFL